MSRMLWHAKPTIEKKSEIVITHCGNNDISKDADLEKILADIINLSKSVSEESDAIISALVQRKGCLNAEIKIVKNRLPDYCGNHMLISVKHDNIHAKTHCNDSGLHFSSKGVSLFNQNFVSLFNTLNSEN